MKKLTRPDKINLLNVDITSTLDAIFRTCTRKGIDNLSTIKHEWLAELTRYPLEMESSKRLDPTKHKSFAKNKEILTWLYENPLESRKTYYIKKIRDIYIEEGITCPYCGIGSSTTLDHYYCKSSLPQFSILQENLIPCCGECNKSKGTLKPKKKWKRIFNPYYDDFESKLNAPPIVVHFKKKGDNIFFHITPNPLLSRKDRMHIGFHLSNLKIKIKHKEKIISHFHSESQLLKSFNTLLNDGELTKVGYDRSIASRLELKNSTGYDWSSIIFYSLYKYKDNHWCIN
ncbi:HNH endonuclease [Serratia liquefaciens]|uniref:HNH endonuclease n=1 Tax=Serratia liquefaciens TaxID=614 RepID=UPI00095A8B70|nr:hypothetical protein [Serratia liquefaciens]OKP19910.1 hypothetical protein BSQ35_16495 [Serratia liquefaciens]